MAKFFKEIRGFPGRWLGVSPQYNPEFVEWLKASIPVRAWDKGNQTWWFPESYEPIVTAEMVRRGLLTPEKARQFAGEYYAHQKLGTSEEPYRILGLQPGVPRPMIDIAYQFWKQYYAGSKVGTMTQAQEIEEAYANILQDSAVPV